MTTKDNRILSLLNELPRRLPARKIVVVLLSTHPCTDIYGMCLIFI